MFWQVGSEPYAEKQLGEEPDVCPAGTFPEGGACWLLGKTGASCQAFLDDAGMQLNLRDQTRQPDLGTLEHPRLDLFHEPHVPHIVAAQSGHRPLLDIQHPWAPFECFVPEESRFHLAATWLEQDPAWSYPICALVTTFDLTSHHRCAGGSMMDLSQDGAHRLIELEEGSGFNSEDSSLIHSPAPGNGNIRVRGRRPACHSWNSDADPPELARPPEEDVQSLIVNEMQGSILRLSS
eukprot:g32486.t3